MVQLITRDDAIRAGLCSNGVHKWAAKFAPAATAIAVEDAVRLDPESADWIYQAAGLDGDSYGYGYDDGGSHGERDGTGYSYSYIDGGEFSYGFRYDYSYGYGDGDGDGCGEAIE